MPDSQVLLIVDMISDFAFPDGTKLAPRALTAAKAIAALRARIKLPTIFVNDNFHQWHVTFESIIDKARSGSSHGKAITEMLAPGPDDHYILKPHQSGFYQTALEALLRDLKINELIVTGVTTDMCILATAIDAHMRGFTVRVPNDCCNSFQLKRHKQALDLIERNYAADVAVSTAIPH